MKRNSEVLIADFFYSFRGGNRQTSHAWMLQSLLYQLLSQDERLFPLFRDIYRARRSDPGFNWQYEDLKGIFKSLATLETSHKIYILLDAMDESVALGRPEILGMLSELCLSGTSCIFKCLIATRPLPAGEIDERGDHCHLIIMQYKNRQDIKNVIKSGIKDLEKLARQLQIAEEHISEDEMEFTFVEEYMTKHAYGVFLWVVLVLEELRKLVLIGPSQEALESHLVMLPLELEDIYSLIIHQLINRKPPIPDMTEKAWKMLAWVAFAERPLRSEEFCDAIAVSPTTKHFSPDRRFLGRNRVHGLERHIRSYCGPLLEVRESVVQLFHLTVREFLLREDKSAKPLNIDEQRSDTEISLACIRYLRLLILHEDAREIGSWVASDYGDFVKWLGEHPLFDYVVTFLVRHLSNLKQNSIVFKEMRMFLKEIQKKNAMYLLFYDWKELLDKGVFKRPKPMVEPITFRIKCLVAAAERNSGTVVAPLIKLQTNINGIDEATQEFALLAAARQGHSEVAQLLVKMGADVDIKNSDGWSAARWAAKEGHLSMLKEVAPTSKSLGSLVNGTSEITMAAENGHTEVIKYLVDIGVDSRSPLLLAAHKGQWEAFTHLRRKAKAGIRDINWRTILHLAAEGGNENIVRYHLAAGAKADERDISEKTSLHWAAIGGHERVLNLFLDEGIDPNLKDLFGRTSLHLAAINKREAAVLALLYGKADPNSSDDTGRTALHYAVEYGYQKVTLLLLRNGADPNFPDHLGRTPLHVAVEHGLRAIVELLLENGADPNARDTSFRTALQYAADAEQEDAWKLLLAKISTQVLEDNNGFKLFRLPWRQQLTWAKFHGLMPINTENCVVKDKVHIYTETCYKCPYRETCVIENI